MIKYNINPKRELLRSKQDDRTDLLYIALAALAAVAALSIILVSRQSAMARK